MNKADRIAEDILTNYFMKKYGWEEKRARERAREEMNKKPPLVAEAMVGEFTCPVCGMKVAILHRYGKVKKRHSVEDKYWEEKGEKQKVFTEKEVKEQIRRIFKEIERHLSSRVKVGNKEWILWFKFTEKDWQDLKRQFGGGR